MSKEFKLVPVEPTVEMREAFHQANDEFEDGEGESPDHQWSAMLAAAPQPPALGGELETRLLEEMSTRFELHRSDDNWLCVDDTQLGVEFAAEFFRPHLAPLQAEIERTNARLHDVATPCASVEQERDQLKTRCDELEGLLSKATEQEIDTVVQRDKFKALLRDLVHDSLASDFNEHWDSYQDARDALSKPAGSEQV